MKIVVVDFAASEGGALSIIKDFANHVRDNYQNHEWIFLLSDFHIEEEINLKVKIIKNSKIRRLFFDDFIGSKIINKLNPDIILNFQNTYIEGAKAPQIIYLHQAIPFQREVNFNIFRRDEFKYAIIQKLLGKRIIGSVTKADKVIVQTEWMKKAVLNLTDIEHNRVLVFPPHINIRKKRKLTSTYNNNLFFYPTGDEIYKNFEVIEDASNMINNLEFKVEVTIKRKLNNKHIESIGMISRGEVFKKYQDSILLFPSKIETFGMPLAEAKEFNCIILASDTEFSREILEGYNNAYFFNPNDSYQLSNLMELCINSSIKQENCERDRNQYMQLNDSWDTIINVLLSYDKH